MKGSTQILQVGGRRVLLYLPPAGEDAKRFPVVYLNAGEEWQEQLKDVMDILEPLFENELLPFFAAAVLDVDWERDFTPWPAPALSKKSEPFSGGHSDYLRYLTQELKPYIDANFPTDARPEYTGIAGYSLGGLAALATAYETDQFGRVGSFSGSLWYDGWTEFVQTHTIASPDVRIYLSLGDAESKSRNERMRTVADATEETLTILRQQLIDPSSLRFDWNEGGHFRDVPQRFAKGLRFLMAK